jgi:hypothetical protein
MPNVRLKTEYYFKDIVALGTEINSFISSKRTGSLSIGLFVGDALATTLIMTIPDLYIISFKGADRVYAISEFGGENYNDLGMPTTLSRNDLNELVALGTYRKGVKLDKTLITRAIVVTSEATRFQAVHMRIQGLLSGVYTSLPLKEMDKQYFKEWSVTSDYIRTGAFTPGPQIVIDVLCAPDTRAKKK